MQGDTLPAEKLRGHSRQGAFQKEILPLDLTFFHGLLMLMFLELCGWLALSEEVFLQGALLLGGGGVAWAALGQDFRALIIVVPLIHAVWI